MGNRIDNYISRQSAGRAKSRSRRNVLMVLSLYVVTGVFWCLKLTGITMAGEAFCGQEEHCHSTDCGQYALVCRLTEQEAHTHSESCILQTLACTQQETAGHTHSEECYTGTLVCTQAEQPAHTHSDECRGIVHICGMEEIQPHTHSEACYGQQLVCTDISAEHTHGEGCYQNSLICTVAETEGHTHTAECEGAGYICGTEETAGHVHSGDCCIIRLTCTQQETAGHSHSGSCYTPGTGFGCGMTEAGGHSHTADCITADTQLACGREATEGHTHGRDCYQFTGACTTEEHIHTESCYSNINADLETSADWEATLPGIVENARPAENLVAVAMSQLGYTESVQNFQMGDDGLRHGYTRYGRWYGNPYGDWSAMFTSFCLHYSGLMGIPMNSGPESMRCEWQSAGIYVSADELAQLSAPQETVTEETPVTETPMGLTTADAENTQADTAENTTEQSAENGAGDSAITDRSAENTETITTEITDSATPETETDISGENTATGEIPADETPQTDTAQQSAETAQTESPAISEEDMLLDDMGTGPRTLPADTYRLQKSMQPQAGSLVFLDKSGNGAADAVAIVTERGETAITVVEGDLENSVAQTVYDLTDTAIMGYGYIPDGSLLMTTADRCVVWLDGTDGGLGHLRGSPGTAYSIEQGSTIALPTTWTSPSKYSYRLRGWYDITNGRYYLPGRQMEVTGNAVLYADWVAATYDIGIFNAQVADTVSTNSFITTHMFDYNYLLNIHSANYNGSVSASDHSESWSMVTSGTVKHNNRETLDFVFIDNDTGGLLCMPNNRSSHNIYPGAGIITPGIYSDAIGELLFSTDNIFDPATGQGVLGKTYLGTGDHLFQIMDDPADEHYGYYYYDSRRNAASYNQTNSRFYVYEYLSATSDAIGSTYSDFLPLNSPYANTNGKEVGTYTYAGIDGEYSGTTHYKYNAKYSASDGASTDYAYGMRTDIRFYLPNEPGTGGNKDLYGNDMQFQFSGDDDLWVLIDGQLVLDIGGIHGAEDGVIDFTTGQVTVQGNRQTSLSDLGITAGDHTLSILYLERGSSLSNCSIYFNLAPRFGLEIQKEDVLTQEQLNGAKFTVYEDFECTQPAQLWESETAYKADAADGTLDRYRSTFTIENGKTAMWGLGAGNTYYLKETNPPDKAGYGLAQGVIRLKIERAGQTTYDAEVITDADGNEASNGFTVHGVEIDEETQMMYITVTNAPETVTDTTTVQVIKKWEDDADHSADYITAYLKITDPDGTVRRIREIVLSDENEWQYMWTNLPKYDYEQLTEIQYGIEESYESGYYSTVRKITQIEITSTEWAEATSFAKDESYILKVGDNYLSTTSATDAKLKWVDEATAQSSSLASWTATVSSGKVKLTNGAGQTLTFNYGNSSSRRYFYATAGSSTYQSFTPVDAGTGFRFYATRSNRNYYIGTTLTASTGRINATTSSGSGMVFTPYEKITDTDIQDVHDWAYQITNTPLEKDNETSVTVKKDWDIPEGMDATFYQEYNVTVRLMANGAYAGRTVTLNLKNNWQDSFLGLPYKDADGNVIAYSVKEIWDKKDWHTDTGEIDSDGGSPPTYSVTITNKYTPSGPMMPSTGSFARQAYVYCGGGIMLASLITAIRQRRKQERRKE